MTELLPELITISARRAPGAEALISGDDALSYAALDARVDAAAQGLLSLGLGRAERVAIYLEKRVETVVGVFGAARAGAVFVPVNPLLRPRQVGYIMNDCNVRVLITSRARLAGLEEVLDDCHDLHTVVLVDGIDDTPLPPHVTAITWADLLGRVSRRPPHRAIDLDMAAILYTSGSTGMPKGVVLSHRNMVVGAKSVSQYLENVPSDRILCVLQLSFDAGFSQLTTTFNVGACAVLTNYLFPRDVVKLVERHAITGIGAVPPLWHQLAGVDWPEAASRSVRYFTNTGGHMPLATLTRLRAALPHARPYLMYGLTEAFRSTYLPPAEVDRRPDSIGKAIPNAEILVVRENGEPCGPGEPGELVHRGALVSLGYWNDPERTAQRFRPVPGQAGGLCIPELAVWSGDTVRADEEGFLYFIGRRDEMIKTSGYRVSPTEVEEIVYSSGLVGEAAAVGVAHPELGQGIVMVVTPPASGALDVGALKRHCQAQLPAYMVPHLFVEKDVLKRNPNGKIDRRLLSDELADSFGAGVP